MGEDKDMKKIISLLILLLSLTGLYALNPPAWMMGYWFKEDDNLYLKMILKVTPDNIIYGSPGIDLINYYMDIHNTIKKAEGYSDYYEEYDDDSYTITAIDRRTGDILKIWSFYHDTIDNRLVHYIWNYNDGEWDLGWSYTRNKPENLIVSPY